MRHYLLELTAFVAGAAVMVLELTGSRVLAPYTGLAINVWTILIGTILIALAGGYWYGGRLADKAPKLETLSRLLAGAAVGIAITGIIRDVLLAILVHAVGSYVLAGFFGTLFLFVPASFCLAAVGPVAARIRVTSVETSGRAVGRISACSTLGSIVGTFLTGLVLFAYFGTTWILAGTASLLFITAILLLPRKTWIWRVAVFVFVVLLPPLTQTLVSRFAGTLLTDTDTAYQRVIVLSGKDSVTGRPTRDLVTDNLGIQSAVFTDQDDDLVLRYLKLFRLADYFVPNEGRALVIGGGAFTYPRDWLRKHPDGQVDVVEIDPGLQDISKRYFGLIDDARMHIYPEDGRTFLNRVAANSYDVVMVDAFRQLTPPFQLTTVEAVRAMHSALKPGGVVLVNIISAIDGPRGKFLRAERATFASVFKAVDLFPVGNDSTRLENVMLLARTNDAPEGAVASPEVSKYLAKLYTDPVANDVPIFTDEFAPVDQYLAAAVGR